MIKEKMIPDIPIVALSGDSRDMINHNDYDFFVDICNLY